MTEVKPTQLVATATSTQLLCCCWWKGLLIVKRRGRIGETQGKGHCRGRIAGLLLWAFGWLEERDPMTEFSKCKNALEALRKDFESLVVSAGSYAESSFTQNFLIGVIDIRRRCEADVCPVMHKLAEKAALPPERRTYNDNMVAKIRILSGAVNEFLDELSVREDATRNGILSRIARNMSVVYEDALSIVSDVARVQESRWVEIANDQLADVKRIEEEEVQRRQATRDKKVASKQKKQKARENKERKEVQKKAEEKLAGAHRLFEVAVQRLVAEEQTARNRDVVVCFHNEWDSMLKEHQSACNSLGVGTNRHGEALGMDALLPWRFVSKLTEVNFLKTASHVDVEVSSIEAPYVALQVAGPSGARAPRFKVLLAVLRCMITAAIGNSGLLQTDDQRPRRYLDSLLAEDGSSSDQDSSDHGEDEEKGGSDSEVTNTDSSDGAEEGDDGSVTMDYNAGRGREPRSGDASLRQLQIRDSLPRGIFSITIHRALRFAVFLAHGGYFAGAIFNDAGVAVRHKTITRYVTRRGQGGRQSGHSGRTDTAGSQIRAHNETKWIQEISDLVAAWGDNLKDASVCTGVFVHAPGSRNKFLREALTKAEVPEDRIYGVPLRTGRPTLVEAKSVYSQLIGGWVLI